VRLAQLRGRIATLARGGTYDLAHRLLGDLVRADLALGLPADALQRARQVAQLAEETGGAAAGPLISLAATLLAADAPDGALQGAMAALDRAAPEERARIEVMASLVGGAAQRRLGNLADARYLLERARSLASKQNDAMLAGFALAELAWVDHAEGNVLQAATAFEFAAAFFRRAENPHAAAEADALSVASFASAGDVEAATVRAARAADVARHLKRPELVAFLDGALADLALARRAADDEEANRVASEACALAAETAEVLPATPLSRDLRAQARLRQMRATTEVLDRERHLEAGIDLAIGLERPRSGARLGAALIGLLDDAVAFTVAPSRTEVSALRDALARSGEDELAEMAAGVLAELGAG
jgi:hypothetical protein